jgi:two-component sensor histidine kinase
LRKWIVGKDDFDYAALKNLPTQFAQERRDFFIKMLHSNGESLWMDKQVNALGEVKYKERRFYTYDNKKFVIGYGVDVTAFKEQEILLSTSVEEKEALLGEVHHRVKNNLALVLGLIEMQQISTTDAIVTSQLSEIRNRITTMSLIHEKLYKSSNFAKIDLKDYLEDLVKFLSNYYNKGKEITLNFDLEQIFAITDKAIPIALIVNELITNSFKYAFEQKKEGIIAIKLKEMEGEIHLIVSDNGPGLPDNLNLLKSDSLGYKLLNIFVRQIKGSYEYENNQGLSIKIKFKND